MNTKKVIEDNNFHIKKKFGQNFLTNKNILEKIANSANLNDSIGVIEIGPGLGALTIELAKRAKHVLAYEIDSELIPILKNNLSDFNNITVLNQDILESDVNKDINEYLNECKEIYVVANLPYYITTPILLGMLQKTHVNKYIVMMQLEVADRLCGTVKTKDYNSLSITIQYQASVKKLFKVPRTVFNPMPNVDSAVIEINVFDELPIKAKREDVFFDLVRSAFNQRRKTLVNNLINRYGEHKDIYYKILYELNLKETVRSEELTIKDFIDLSDKIYTNLTKSELLDLYDIKGNKLNKKIARNDYTEPNTYVKVVSCILKYKDKYYIQKRSSFKIHSPNEFEIPGGAVLANETEISACVREIKEELNINIIDPILVDKVMYKNIIRCIYFKEIDDINITLNEATEYMFVSKDELKNISLFKKFGYVLDEVN